MRGPPPKPSGGSRGFGGERRSSEMNELSPLGGSERYGACDDEGAAPCGRPQGDVDVASYGYNGPFAWDAAVPACYILFFN